MKTLRGVRTIGWAVGAAVLLTGLAACGGTSSPTAGGPVSTPTTASTDASLGQAATTAPAPGPAPVKTSTNTGDPNWPSPADCISYNPRNVTVSYANGIYTVADGSTVVMKLHGDVSDDTGQKGLALAQHFGRHCFIGRGNHRDQPNMYVMDYWRDPSGLNPNIPDQDQDCSNYNRNNLTVEDMGDNDGWRVKDHDHVLHLFDNGNDARNGKLVLLKYSNICSIGNTFDDNQDAVNYQF
jgi:hypothetical protein